MKTHINSAGETVAHFPKIPKNIKTRKSEEVLQTPFSNTFQKQKPTQNENEKQEDPTTLPHKQIKKLEIPTQPSNHRSTNKTQNSRGKLIEEQSLRKTVTNRENGNVGSAEAAAAAILLALGNQPPPPLPRRRRQPEKEREGL